MIESHDLIQELVDDILTTIIIDALDECNADRRHELLGVLEAIIRGSSKPVKILVSSRDSEEDISTKLMQSLTQVAIRKTSKHISIQKSWVLSVATTADRSVVIDLEATDLFPLAILEGTTD